MMDLPLNIWLLFDHAARHYADVEVVSLMEPGRPHRYTYGDFSKRARVTLLAPPVTAEATPTSASSATRAVSAMRMVRRMVFSLQ